MRINKNISHTKRNIVIVLVASLLVVAGVGTWFFLNNSTTQELRENVVNYKQPTKEQKKAGLDAKSDFNKKYYSKTTEDNKDTELKNDVSVLITSMNQNSNILTIATSLETLDSGTCELKLLRSGSSTVTMRVAVVKVTTYSACEDFNVDVTNLEKGEWTAQVDYQGSSSTGTTSSKVSIK